MNEGLVSEGLPLKLVAFSYILGFNSSNALIGEGEQVNNLITPVIKQLLPSSIVSFWTSSIGIREFISIIYL